jgi:hypothetical protein
MQLLRDNLTLWTSDIQESQTSDDKAVDEPKQEDAEAAAPAS